MEAPAAVFVALVLIAGCGTRLPDSAFKRPSPTPATSQTTGGPSTDSGVTATTIRIGNIVSRTNIFDGRAFIGPYYGVQAFVDDLNARGGINGRRLILDTCDDHGSGSANVDCVRRLTDHDHVFALVGNAILNYDGAPLVQKRGVPDIGSEPIDTAYVRYSHLFDVLGESYPRDGAVGFNGVLHAGTEIYQYFKQRYPREPLRAGIVNYNQGDSRRYAQSIAAGLKLLGYRVTRTEVNFALPDYDSAVITMKHAGVRYVYDALDRLGNERLCRAIDDNRLALVAKITTTQSWEASIRNDYQATPACRNVLFATGGAENYDDRTIPAVAQFRAAMGRKGWDRPSTMSEWALEGWAGAQWFADAATSCGQDLTRQCVEQFMVRRTPYDGHGLLIPRGFTVGTAAARQARNCVNVVRWRDTANGGRGGWVTQVADMTTNCYVGPVLSYRP